MSKASTSRRREPSRASLREMPPIDFTRYRVERNRFAERVAMTGIEVVHDEPSPASLAEIPEAALDTAVVRPNPYAKRIAAGGMTLQVGRGRPRAAERVGPTVTRSIRLPPTVWADLERRARAEDTTVHALLRRAILRLLESDH